MNLFESLLQFSQELDEAKVPSNLIKKLESDTKDYIEYETSANDDPKQKKQIKTNEMDLRTLRVLLMKGDTKGAFKLFDKLDPAAQDAVPQELVKWMMQNDSVELDEKHYRKADPTEPIMIPPKWVYDELFKRLKQKKVFFNQLKAEEALEQVYLSGVGDKKRTMGDLLDDAMKRYADIVGITIRESEELEEKSLADMVPVKHRSPSHKPKKVSAIRLVLPDTSEIRAKMEKVLAKDNAYRKKMFDLVLDREERDNGELVLQFASFRGREKFSQMMNDA